MKKKLVYISLLAIVSLAGYAQQTDAYGGFLDIKGEKTGFFHTELINDRWCLVTPQGQLFFSIGLNHIDPASLRYPENIHIWEEKYHGSTQGPSPMMN